MLIAGNDERNVAAWESDRRILSVVKWKYLKLRPAKVCSCQFEVVHGSAFDQIRCSVRHVYYFWEVGVKL